MANTNATKAGSGVQPRAGNDITAVYESYTLASATLNDTYTMCKIPAGATILDVVLSSDDVDTNGTPTVKYDVGDSGSATRFISATTIGQAGGVARMDQKGGHLKAYTADDTVIVKINTAAATFAAGTIRVGVLYTMQQ
jgi:hypothetical protein